MRDIADLFTQLAILIRAGIPIAKSVSLLSQTQSKMRIAQLLRQILADIHLGKSLFYCLSKHPFYFTPMICQLIRIGEHTGKLDEILTMIAHHLDKESALIKRLNQALFYPCFVLCCAFFIMGFIFIYIIPRFAELFTHFNLPLPTLTRILLTLSALAREQASTLLVILTLASMYIAMRKKRRAHFLHLISVCIYRVPFLHHHFKKIALVYFARQLALLFTAGIPIDRSLLITAEANPHQPTRQQLKAAALRVQAGSSLAQAVSEFAKHSPLLIQFIRIGEESGQLDMLLNRFAELLEGEIDAVLTRATQLLEPLIMLVLGVLIGGVVLSLYLPLFNLGNML